MRVATLVALVVCVALATLATCCRAHGKERALALEDDDDDLRPLYRDYAVRARAAREDAIFDDYGYLRFGRSDD